MCLSPRVSVIRAGVWGRSCAQLGCCVWIQEAGLSLVPHCPPFHHSHGGPQIQWHVPWSPQTVEGWLPSCCLRRPWGVMSPRSPPGHLGWEADRAPADPSPLQGLDSYLGMHCREYHVMPRPVRPCTESQNPRMALGTAKQPSNWDPSQSQPWGINGYPSHSSHFLSTYCVPSTCWAGGVLPGTTPPLPAPSR